MPGFLYLFSISLSCRVVPRVLQGVLACPQGAVAEEEAKATGARLVGR